MSRPRLLDLFCGAGGAAMGYHRAGFEVVGVDILPQPHYPFEFHKADALEYSLKGFDAIHASPNCQVHSTLRSFNPDFPFTDWLPEIRARLGAVSIPWVIENVPGAPGPWSLMLCGAMFNLQVRRHRLFQLNWQCPADLPPHLCKGPFLDMYSAHGRGRKGTDRQYVDAMGITWAPLENRGPAYSNGRQKLAQQAIPPTYTEWLGGHLLQRVVA